MFVSTLPRGCEVIDDSNWQQFALPNNGSQSVSGYISPPRDWRVPRSARFPSELLIHESEWKERIEEKERLRQRLSDLASSSEITWLNQNPSNGCWTYAVVHAVTLFAQMQGEPYRLLVPESVRGPIKNYRDVGGWGSQAIEFIADEGIADISAWPRDPRNVNAALNRRYYEPSRENARQTRVTEWWELRTTEEKVSCLLHNIPVPSGYGWMGHEMCSIDVVILRDGSLGFLDLDSYARNGEYNTKVLPIRGRRSGTGEDMVAPVSISPNQLEAA